MSYVLLNLLRIFDAGLEAMKAPSGVFIQFSCGANETTTSDLFNQQLLRYINEENTGIQDVFQHISDGVYRESSRRQRPLSMNGLARHDPICLNEVYRPPICPLINLNQNEIKPLLKKQAELREHFDVFPSIEEVTDQNNPHMRQAAVLTDSILSQTPSGDCKDTITACHILSQLFADQGGKCMFFNSKQGMKLHDASANLADFSVPERPFVLKLSSNDGLGNANYEKDEQYDLKLVHTLTRSIEGNQPHPVMEDIRERLAKAHRVDKNNVVINNVFVGSFNIVYMIQELKTETISKLPDIPKNLKRVFPLYDTAKIHPLLCRPAFDISDFDVRGNKDFCHEGGTFEVGPPGRTRAYQQPYGWTRYGLKVLGKYSNDAWLHPFKDPLNWYRAYHGTKNASPSDFDKPKAPFDKEYAPVDAMASIHRKGFREARIAAYGSGVYCSPSPTFVEDLYAATVQTDTKQRKKTYKCMLQVATNPDGPMHENGAKNIWVIPNPKDIRAYGILIKEIGSHTFRPMTYDD